MARSAARKLFDVSGKWACPAFFIVREVRLHVLTAKENRLLAALEPRAVEEGIEIVTIEIVGAKRAPTIRVYVDILDEDASVSFDVLSAAQAWIGELMDEIDPFPGAYTLEVSSPGIDRPLRTPAHFQRFAGETVVVKTASPLDGRSSFTGVLGGMEDDDVLLEVDGADARIPYGIIKRASVKGTYDFNRITDTTNE